MCVIDTFLCSSYSWTLPHTQKLYRITGSVGIQFKLQLFPPLLTLTRSFRYVCIRGVFILTTECASLTVTLVVTLRKFLSLIFSIIYFQNPFTAWHWVGTAVVFMGTLLYTEVWSSMQAAVWRKEKKVE